MEKAPHKREAAPRKVLAVERTGAGFGRFFLMIDGLETITVSNHQATWAVDNDATETMAVVVNKREEQKGSDKKKLVLKRVKITGPQQQISNLLLAIGSSTAESVNVQDAGIDPDD